MNDVIALQDPLGRRHRCIKSIYDVSVFEGDSDVTRRVKFLVMTSPLRSDVMPRDQAATTHKVTNKGFPETNCSGTGFFFLI